MDDALNFGATSIPLLPDALAESVWRPQPGLGKRERTRVQLVQAAIRDYALADLRLGVKQKAFRIPNEAAAMDMVNGTVAQAMRSVALGLAPPNHGRAVATCVLRGLGMEAAAAKEVAHRPLPPFPPL